jgi:hypothetical protein
MNRSFARLGSDPRDRAPPHFPFRVYQASASAQDFYARRPVRHRGPTRQVALETTARFVVTCTVTSTW